MGKGDKPKDARETLNQLEQRLRDLERELRAGVPDESSPEPVPAVPEAPHAAPAAVPVPAEIEVLVDEARVRAGALHDSLDGLVDVNDHLRDTAQTLVEDYGRLLVRVSRLAAPSTPAEEQQPEAPATEAVPEPPDRPPIFVPNLPPEAAAALVRPPWETPDPPRRRRRRRRRRARWLIPLLILLVAAAATAAVLRSRQSDSSRPTPAAGTRQLLVVSDAAGLPLGSARRSTGPAAVAAVCAGRAAGAVVAARDARPCPGAAVVTSVTTSATGVVSPRRADGRGRRCLTLAGPGRPGAHRTSRPATRARARAIERGGRTASEAARADELPPATLIRATRAGARQAAVSYDADHQLRALAIAARAGGACVRPTAANLLSGRYPLARRLVLLAGDRAAASAAVTVARRTLDRAFGGAPALDADVTG